MSYTINRTGENIAALLDKVEEGAVGKITIGIEQVIGMDPVAVLFTPEQLEIIADHNVLEIDTSQIGFPSCTWLKDPVNEEFTALRMDNYEFTGSGISFDGLNIIAIDNSMGAGQLFQYVDGGGISPEERAELASHEARIVNLEAAAQGKLYREEVDSTEDYSKTVPAGSLPYAAVTSVESAVIDGEVYSPTAVLVHGVNWMPEDMTYASGAINGSTGGNLSSSNRRTSYLDVRLLRGKTITTSYRWTSKPSNDLGVAFYDENRSFVSGFVYRNHPVSEQYFVVPNDAFYARFTVRAESLDPTPMIVIGQELPSETVPYREPDRYELGRYPLFVPVNPRESISVENDIGDVVPMPSSVTYAINVQEAIANE